MNISEDSIINDLQSLKLTKNESKAVLALIKIGGYADAPTIANLAGIPRSRIYQVLEDLADKEIVNQNEIEGSANTYRLMFSDIKKLISHLYKTSILPIELATKRLSDELSTFFNTHKRKKDIHEVWITKGFNKVIKVEKEIVDSANHLIISNVFPDFLIPIKSNLKSARIRGVHIKLILLEEEITELSKSMKIESVSTQVTGVSTDKLKEINDAITMKSDFKELRSLFILFTQILVQRPNILLIDPNSENAKLLLLMKSETDYSHTIAIHIQNKDFINFAGNLMNVIFSFASTAKSMQDKFKDLY